MSKPDDRPEFVRLSLTIPADLKRELETLAAAENWSAWAAECFRGRLLAIKARKTGGSMQDVISRLKAAARLEQEEDVTDGKECGAEWARYVATPRQLRRLEQFQRERIGERLLKPGEWPIHVARAIDGVDVDVRDFWADTVGEDEFDRVGDAADDGGIGPFLRGFIAGAVDVWREVKKAV